MGRETLPEEGIPVGLEKHEELVHFLITWCGANPLNAHAQALEIAGAASATRLSGLVGPMSIPAEFPEPAKARSRRRVKPGLPPRDPKWERQNVSTSKKAHNVD